MSITIYGSPHSRTMRVLWMAAELELEFVHIPIEFNDPALKDPNFLALNPAGAIPTIVDGQFSLSESLAINFYLAKKYGTGGPEPLYPSTIEGEGDVVRWSLWAQGHLEPWIQKDLLLAELIETIGHRAEQVVMTSVAILDRALSDRNWISGEHFSVSDLNVAGVLSPSRSALLDLSDYRNVSDWLYRCYARPAAVATRKQLTSVGIA